MSENIIEEPPIKKQKKEETTASSDGQQTATPRLLRVTDFAKTRGLEIKFLKENLETKSGNKRIFQTLPRYLRRRSMSHNLHRVPRRIRFLASLEVTTPQGNSNSGNSEGNNNKRVRYRKHKRRPGFILFDYQRRISPSKKWLISHMWHAKRMKMENIWNYLLPIYSTCDSKSRFIYRSLFHSSTNNSNKKSKEKKKNTFLYDKSYYAAIVLSGEFTQLCNLFSSSKQKQQSVLLSPISSISSISPTSMKRNWFAEDNYVSGSFEGNGNIFSFSAEREAWELISPISFLWDNSNKKEQREICIWVHPSSYDQLYSILSLTASLWNVSVVSRVDQIQRYSLMGSHTSSDQSILSIITYSLNSFSKEKIDSILENQISSKSKSHNGDIHSRSIFRVSIPATSLLVSKSISSSASTSDNKLLMTSSADNKHLMTSTVFTTPVIHSLSDLNLLNVEILLSVQYIRSKHPCHSLKTHDIQDTSSFTEIAEWDIIIPPLPIAVDSPIQSKPSKLYMQSQHTQQSLLVWHKLIKSGAKVIGLDDRISIFFELNIPFFPLDFPDTNAYQLFSKQTYDKLSLDFSKRPKSKRINYQKMNIPFPFCCPWFTLHSNYIPIHQPVFSTFLQVERIVYPKLEYSRGDLLLSLVQVSITMLSRGTPSRFSIIYAPSNQQLSLFFQGKFEDKEHKEKCSDKQIIGYVTSGGFSFLLGFGSGIGFCKSSSLIDLSNRSRSLLGKHTLKAPPKEGKLISKLKEKILKPEESENNFFVFIRNIDSPIFFPAIISKTVE